MLSVKKLKARVKSETTYKWHIEELAQDFQHMQKGVAYILDSLEDKPAEKQDIPTQSSWSVHHKQAEETMEISVQQRKNGRRRSEYDCTLHLDHRDERFRGFGSVTLKAVEVGEARQSDSIPAKCTLE